MTNLTINGVEYTPVNKQTGTRAVVTELEYLVARLRSVAETEAEKYERKPQLHVCWEAADEIEKLREALTEIVNLTADPEFGTPPLETAQEIAIAALGETND